MVLAHHLIFTAYGWWLPNDPRGSMSHSIRCDVVTDLGDVHYGRKKIQPASRDIRAFYEQAKEVLKFPLLSFTLEEMHAISLGFANVIAQYCYTCYACSIMPDHVHLCVRKHRDLAEDMIAHFQFASAEAVQGLGLRVSNHPVWGGAGWKVYLDSAEDIERTIRYVEQNPTKSGMPRQAYPFVTPYDGWPLRRRRR